MTEPSWKLVRDRQALTAAWSRKSARIRFELGNGHAFELGGDLAGEGTAQTSRTRFGAQPVPPGDQHVEKLRGIAPVGVQAGDEHVVVVVEPGRLARAGRTAAGLCRPSGAFASADRWQMAPGTAATAP